MLVLVGGPVAALPLGDGDQLMVLFAPGVKPGDAFDVLGRAGAKVLWVDKSGGLWAIKVQDRRVAWRLYRHGALMVSNSAVGFGCLTWARPG